MSNNHIPMGLRHGAVVGVLLFAGCLVKDPYYCGDGHCELEGFPFCDVDGSISGLDGPRCIAVECEPLQFKACRGDDEALICNTTGDNYDVTHCEHGCNTETGGCNACTPGTSECEARIIPQYMPTACENLAAAPELVVAESMIFEETKENCNGGFYEQADGSCICVVRYGTINIPPNKTLKVLGGPVIFGSGNCALALVADYALTIEGTLDVSADTIERNGPGRFDYSLSMVASDWPSGSGGAGFKDRGGHGGSSSSDGGAFNAGYGTGNPATLATLGGGRVIAKPEHSAFGGGAGGGATLISCRGTVSVVGLIDAGGGGGEGGFIDGSIIGRMSGGGGSGGHIVLQGMNVSVTGQMYANGGGGGAGGHGPTRGESGADGSRSTTVGARGGVSVAGDGSGGAGAYLNFSQGQDGTKPAANSGFGGGGGGGGLGFFQTYTPAGVTPILTPVAASPAFEPNLTVEVHVPPQ